MRKEDIVQDLVAPGGLRYARILTWEILEEEAENLKKRFSYIQAYLFGEMKLSGFTVRKQHTALIDLNESLEKIFSKFSDTAKKHVRRAERNSDLKIVVLDGDFDGSYALYKKVKSEEGARPDIAEEFKNCLFFNAYLKGEILVTMSFYDNGEVTRAKHIASLRRHMGEEAKIVAQASRLLNWEVCKWGKVNGRKIFDLAGLNLDDFSKKGIVDFKRSFGGKETDIDILRYETEEFSALKKKLNDAGENIN